MDAKISGPGDNPSLNLEKENYERALQLAQYHAQVLWWAFGTYLVVETLILGFLAQSISNFDPSRGMDIKVWLFGASIFGILLVLPWWTTFNYTHAQYLLRINQARRHEPKLGILLLEGKELAEKGKVSINSETIRLDCITHKLPPRYAFKMLILLFVSAYIFTAYIFWPWH